MKLTPSATKLLSAIGVLLAVAATSVNAATQYTYDELNRLTKVVYDDGRSISYTYDAAGNLLKEERVSPAAPAGLVGHWTFDNCNGADSSGSNRSASLVNTVCVAGYGGGKALEFRNPGYNVGGGSDWVELPAHTSDTITFSAWVKWAGASTGFEYAGAIWSIGVHTQPPFLSIWINEGSGKIWTDSYTTSPHKLVPGQWAMLTIATDSVNEWLYLNGELIGNSVLARRMPFSGRRQYLSKHFWAGGSTAARFRGVIDDVRVYDRPLTIQEVKDLHLLTR